MVVREAARTLNMNLFEVMMLDMMGDNVVETDLKIHSTIAKFTSTEPCIIYLSGLEILSYYNDLDLEKVKSSITESLNDLLEKSTQRIIFIGATGDCDRILKTSLPYLFHHQMIMSPPSLDEANELIKAIKEDAMYESDLSQVLEYLTSHDRKYYLGNILVAISKAEVMHYTELHDTEYKSNSKEEDEGTRWLDVGGLADIKKEIIDAIQLSTDYPQLKKSGLRRTGILLYGPPGTGKTLLAKAVATECSLKFFDVKGPELLSEYVGQSEDNVRKLFQKARDSSPSVIFFDEIDSLAPNRGQAGDSGGVMDRMVSQILAELDSVCKCDGVYVIAATNRVDLVDPSLLRPGRFDKVLEVPIPKTIADRLQILKALTRKMKLAKDVDLLEIETLARPNMSGADFKGLCSQAMHKSLERCIQLLESGKKTEDEVEITICRDDFIVSLAEL